MNIRLFNTLSRKKETFKPLNDKKVGLYTCGPTVYNYAHIGNLRTYIFEDVLKRVLQYNDYQVKHVMNITDVGHLTSDSDEGEDKMEKGAKEQKKTVWELAKFYTAAFQRNLADLNILSPEIWCRATDHIKEQITLIAQLEKNGYTYKTSDGIYFDSGKFKNYKKLAQIDLTGLQEGARIKKNIEKKNITDFALWKFSEPGKQRQMQWESPWGKGFPGWHIECSAMAMKYLGETIDIHCGGVDHVPVHHTNELAQSEAATGKKFANYWLHGEFLLINEGRMGKSEGNFITLDTLKERRFNPLAYRLFCFSAHYRSKLNFSWDALKAAQKSLDNLYKTIYDYDDPTEVDTQYQEKFLQAINDDLNMPKALAIVWELVKSDMDTGKKSATLFELDKVLGLQLQESFDKAEEEKAEIPDEILRLAEDRLEAREQKNWAQADKLRKKINSLGYNIDDTKNGYTVKKS